MRVGSGRVILLGVCCLCVFALTAHAGQQPGAGLILHGAGATFPAPLYKKWIETFQRQRPDVRIEYEAVGSGEGIKRFLAGSVDFGASDAALSDEQRAKAPHGAQLVPTTAGMVVLAYTLPGGSGGLKLSRETLVDLFNGRIHSWDDPRLQRDNPGLNLPHLTVVLVVRKDSSGTTFAMTNHLAAVDAAWRDRGPGMGTLIEWPGAPMEAPGNEGVSARIKQSVGAIGYVEYYFARRLNLPMARLQNKAGNFVEPSERAGQQTLTSNLSRIPENLRVFLPDPDGPDSYPLVTFSWLLVHQRYPDREKAGILKAFLAWGLADGQSFGRELGYIPLPGEIAALSLAAVNRLP